MARMKLSEAEKAISALVGSFNGTVILSNMAKKNGKAFQPDPKKAFNRVTIQYGNSETSDIGGEKTGLRHWGMINIQVFVPRESGTLNITEICDTWTDLLHCYAVGGLEIVRVHGPQEIQDPNFYGRLIRAEFKVN